MAKEKFKEFSHFKNKNLEEKRLPPLLDKIKLINSILYEFAAQGYIMTLRQLKYQLIARNYIENTKKDHGKLYDLADKGRMGGLIDWDLIEDRTRLPHKIPNVKDISEALKETAKYHRLDRTKNQSVYIELWAEKNAIAEIIKEESEYYDIVLQIGNGYSSKTAIYRGFKRFQKAQNEGKKIYLLYLGDHDPSGKDMVEAFKKTFNDFKINPDVNVIGIIKEQVIKYKLPHNTVKTKKAGNKDPRAEKYREEEGNKSWEVDALSPTILHKVVSTAIKKLIDMDLFEKQLEREELDKEELQKIADKYEEEIK